MNYSEIIQKLTVEQKLALLAEISALCDESIVEAGVPRVKLKSLADLNKMGEGLLFPRFTAVANSWNTELVTAISADLSARAKRTGVNLVLTPLANATNNIYEDGFSEDPCLIGRLTGACVNALDDHNIMPLIPRFAMTDEEKEYYDITPRLAVIRDYFVRAFEFATENARHCSILTATDKLGGEYSTVNTGLLNTIVHKKFKKAQFVLCDKTDADSAVTSITSGNITAIDGSISALRSAYENYLSLKEELETGKADGDALEKARADGSAISDADIDEAVDKIIAFAFACNGDKHIDEEVDENKSAFLARQVAEQSIVLLKNQDKILPLRGRGKVALIGSVASTIACGTEENLVKGFSGAVKEKGMEFVGYADGYALVSDRSDELIAPAVELAKKADTIVLVLGFNPDTAAKNLHAKSTKLPANRIALIDALAATGKKIIAVVSGEHPIDMDFDTVCKASLLAPVSGSHTGEAIINILSGAVNPSGKLARTRYEKPDAYFKKIKDYKLSGRTKIGPFMGYPYYDTAGEKVKYPFGYGLSYTTFEYSDLSVSASSVTFTLKNTGSVAGSEVVQIYIGKKNSDIIRPKKTLAAFTRVTLAAGAHKRVTVPLAPDAFAVYCDETGTRQPENGEHQIFVCASVSDERLVGKVTVGGRKLSRPADGKLSDYLQTKTNVVSGGYTLIEPDEKKKKKSGVGSVLMLILCIFADLALAVLTILSFTSGIKLLEFNPDEVNFIPTVAVIGGVNLLLLIFACAVGKRNRNLKKEYKVTEKEDEHRTANPYDELFLHEFEEKEEVVKEEKKEEIDDNSIYFDKGVTMARLCEELIKFSTSRGIAIDKKTASAVLAAMSASRLVMLSAPDNDLLLAFNGILCEFFGCPVCVRELDENCDHEDAILYQRNEDGDYKPTKVITALEKAEDTAHRVHIITVNGVKAESVGDYFTKFIRFVSAPVKPTKVTVNKALGGSAYTVPVNTWFIMNLSEGEKISRLPVFVAETAAVVALRLTTCERKENPSPAHPVSSYQFVSLSYECRNKTEVSEDDWKKFDKLEKFVNAHTPFSIGNKLWLQAEKYIGARLVCGDDAADALDGLLAHIILPAVLPVLKGRFALDEGDFTHTVEDWFGEDNIALSRETIKLSGVYEKREVGAND